MLVFIFDYFQDDKIFRKMKKNLFWGDFGPFVPKFGKKIIFLEKNITYSNYLKKEKKLMTRSWKNAELTDGQSDKETMVIL